MTLISIHSSGNAKKVAVRAAGSGRGRRRGSSLHELGGIRMSRQRQREEQQLDDDLACGAISQKEYNQSMRDMERDERDEMRERAEAAYGREMDRP